MENNITLSGKMFNPKSFTTKDGVNIYSFSMGFSKINKKTEAWDNMYIPVSLYDKDAKYEKVMLLDKKEISVQGVLDIKAGYTKNDGSEVPAQLSIFAFEASTGAKMKKTAPQQATQATKAPEPAPTQAQSGPEFPDMSGETSDSVPF